MTSIRVKFNAVNNGQMLWKLCKLLPNFCDIGKK